MQSPCGALPKAHYLRQLHHSSRSRSLLSCLASSKLHPTGGKKISAFTKFKNYPSRMGYKTPFRPENVSNQYRPNPRKTPMIAGFQRGSAPLVGSGAKPRRGLGQNPKKNALISRWRRVRGAGSREVQGLLRRWRPESYRVIRVRTFGAGGDW